MTSPGFSVTELLKAIKKCKDIWDAFTDEYKNAPARVQKLVKTCKYLHDVLLDIKSVIGDNYPQQASFLCTLQECEQFINKYRHLKEEYIHKEGGTSSKQRLRDNWLRIWETTKHEKQRETAGTISNDSQFKELVQHLQSIRWKYEREMSMNAQNGRQPDLTSLYGELNAVWLPVGLKDAFLDTLHSKHIKGRQRRHVAFPASEGHRLEWTGLDGIPHSQVLNGENVKYSFTELRALQQFQGDIRDKDLLETFDTEVIWTDLQPRRNQGEAILVELKVWRDRYPPGKYSLSFLANNKDKGHVEHYLGSFREPAKRNTKVPQEVTLEFVNRRSGSSMGSKGKRNSLVLMIKGITSHSAATTRIADIVQDISLTHSRKSSGTSVASEQVTDVAVTKEPSFLSIEFSTIAEADSFATLFKTAHHEEPTSLFKAFELDGQSSVIRPTEHSLHELSPSERLQPDPPFLTATPEFPRTSTSPLESPPPTSPSGVSTSARSQANDDNTGSPRRQTPSSLLFNQEWQPLDYTNPQHSQG
ncbi:hypothetical protein F5Y19DRAFT_484584 [Xylariaceae sp. FL1651]|nr:hypothetical protein F5Y19DRAFT_484584 [Xylariaceae sp. FL1651]